MQSFEKQNAEQKRLDASAALEVPLQKWGPYLSERQWGTVREDYSDNGDSWSYFPHDHARSRAYLWGEDGIAGLCDRMQDICFAPAFWNGKDPVLKERLFGLNNHEGNHGEDVKELYYYLDNIPSHFYMKYLYKYPQQPFPYNELVQKNAARGLNDAEFEILDTGVFDNNAYFDIFISYAKFSEDDIAIKIEITNRAAESAAITVLPTIWFYNRWQYGGLRDRPLIEKMDNNSVMLHHERAGGYYFYFSGADYLLFTENETNEERIFNRPNESIFVKDAFNDAIVQQKNIEKLAERGHGTKCSPVFNMQLNAGEQKTLYLRLSANVVNDPPIPENIEELFVLRKKEADEFYGGIIKGSDSETANIQRQAFAGLLFNKQYYHFDVERWLRKKNSESNIPAGELHMRNTKWKTLKNQDVISMPDKWEYPWYAAWDAGFHAIAMALIDPVFAKNQLLLLMREWYMNPEGQLPAYEWDFSDVNPPVHAFAAFEIYNIEKKKTGSGDVLFLKKIFQKLIINFTWWVNRKDANGNNIFEGGFLGLDNISLFNRNMPLGEGVVLEQTDGTSWMAMYALNMMDIAVELSLYDQSFEDAATKFYEHFVIIAAALNEMELWDEEDDFFYDVLSVSGKENFPLKIKSVVGLTPLYATSLTNKSSIENLKDFNKRISWFKNYRLNNKNYLPGEFSSSGKTLFSILQKDRLVTLLSTFFDEAAFLSDGGVRSLSKYYHKNPYHLSLGGQHFSIEYNPADSTSAMYGGNSNWRGPVWMPVNYLFIKALQKYGAAYGDTLKMPFPTGSGTSYTLTEIADLLTSRLLKVFLKNEDGGRPVFGAYNYFYANEGNGLVLFHEYFHGDDLSGLGASHQTGWTALLLNLLDTE